MTNLTEILYNEVSKAQTFAQKRPLIKAFVQTAKAEMDVRERKNVQARFPAVLRKRCYRVKEKSSQKAHDEDKAEKPDLERCEESL